MEIGDRPIDDHSAYFIAEIGVNHNGDLDLARELMDSAADAGADAVKFQTFIPRLNLSPFDWVVLVSNEVQNKL